ncbi:MAG TPA: TrkA family potassium uptake protein [Candidatus Dependentiae bacterium]|nr:TrkA family potassium uptake protein [Candidatus Dependentiae bacterium]HRQ62423.1 TrkA family potassium uptake protein [Candidatus Dependentiae bacterium]
MKFCVIGLGRFGQQVAKVLADNGMEVMAIDSNESIVASIRDSVTQAICMRVTDEDSLRSVGVDEMDTVIVATGENFAQSILITALLKKRLHIPQVIARAINDIHKEILTIVGADRVILPEQEIGIKVADNLSSPFIDLIRLSKDFSISQIRAPKSFVGKSLKDLALFVNYKVYCIGLKEDDNVISIDPGHVVKAHDKLIFAGHNDNLKQLADL